MCGLMEIMIVLIGVFAFIVRYLWEFIKDILVNRANSALACMRAQVIHPKYEAQVTQFIDKNLNNPGAMFDLIDDNMKVIYGANYRSLPHLQAGKLTGRYKHEYPFGEENACVGELGLIKCLIMSKKGYVPDAFYMHGITILYTNPFTPRWEKEAELSYISQIQKNLDNARAGVQIVYVKVNKFRDNYDLKTKWKHDYLLPFKKDGIMKPVY